MPEEVHKNHYDIDRERTGERGKEQFLPSEERKEDGTEIQRPAEAPARDIPEEVLHSISYPSHLSREIKEETKEIKKLPRERQVQALVDLAIEKGIRHSIAAARALNSPYILDQFHDVLVDHLYRELIEKGKLKEV